MAPLSTFQVKANRLMASRTLFVHVGTPIATWSSNIKLSRGHQFYLKSTPSKSKTRFGLVPRSSTDGGDKLDETVGVSCKRVFF
jgi:hypothetical protein